MKSLRFIDFCAGIGSGRLGLEQAGMKCVGYSEIDQRAIKTYNLLHDVGLEENFGDLTKIDIKKLPDFDVMIAGFPCQTFSIVGRRKGFEDERGQIIYHLIKILKGKNVPYFILENVKGLASHDKGSTIGIIKSSLEEAGYSVDYRILTSTDFGVPQIRERVYFVGARKDLVKKPFTWPTPIYTKMNLRDYLVEGRELSENPKKTLIRYMENKYNAGRFKLEELLRIDYLVVDTRQSDMRLFEGRVPTLRTGRQGILYVRGGKLWSLTGYEGLLLQGFPKEYAGKVRGNVANSILLAQAGNAMTVSVVAGLAKEVADWAR
ncbi:MAG: DNA (cytosine-5-)-methyltransferase [Firmicutes bacterium]|nr:DNA (cytosine-5-)-methyltransferase [Bacillota bacterium]